MRWNQERSIKSITLMTMFALIISMFSPLVTEDVMAASSRAASVVEVKGTAYLKKAGGNKPYRIFKKMTVNQGDTIVTEANSSVVLEILERDDEVTIGENSEVYVADLVEDKTGLTVWSGNVSSAVSKLSGSETYKIDTPNATMGVRGTHFVIGIEPNTGRTILQVFSGIVQSERNGNGSSQSQSDSPSLIYPAMEGIFIDFEDEETGSMYTEEYITSFLTSISDPAVIESILRNKALIDQENEELLNSGSTPLTPSNDGLEGPMNEDIERLKRNLENALLWMLQQSVQKGHLSKEQLQAIIDSTNAQLPNDFDLNREIPPIDRSAGIDPEQEQRRQQQRLEAEQRKQQQQQQKEQKRQEVANQNQEMIDRIKQQKEEMDRRNREAQEKKQQEATERLKSQLDEAQRKLLEERMNQREQERTNQENKANPPSQPTPSPSEPSNPSPSPSPTYRPSVALTSDELSDSGWDREELVVRVQLKDFPPTFYAAQLHLLFKDKHFATKQDVDDHLVIDSHASDVFTGAAEAYKQKTGSYKWEDESEAVMTTEIVYTVTSTGNVNNARIDRVDGKLWLSIPLQYKGGDLAASGTIGIGEVIFVDREGNRLPYNVTTSDLPYEISVKE